MGGDVGPGAATQTLPRLSHTQARVLGLLTPDAHLDDADLRAAGEPERRARPMLDTETGSMLPWRIGGKIDGDR